MKRKKKNIMLSYRSGVKKSQTFGMLLNLRAYLHLHSTPVSVVREYNSWVVVTFGLRFKIL